MPNQTHEEAQQDIDALLLRLGTLKSRLEEAVALARSGGAKSSEFDRIASHYALVGVLDFLYSFDDLRRLATPLDTLNEALIDIVRGVPASLFATAKTAGRPKQSTRENRVKVFAVLAAEALIAGGMQIPAALKLVADEFNRAGARMGKAQDRPLTDSAVRSWREGVIGRGDDAFVRERLANFRREMSERGAWPPHDAGARSLTKNFARFASRT